MTALYPVELNSIGSSLFSSMIEDEKKHWMPDTETMNGVFK